MRACIKQKEVARLNELFAWLELFETCDFKTTNKRFEFNSHTKIYFA